MEGDYISREAAVKIAEKYGLADGSVLGRHTGLADCIASEISALPAADVAEVVHGKWIPCDNGGYYCSNCDTRIAFRLGEYFCNSCGAMMDGGKDRAVS